MLPPRALPQAKFGATNLFVIMFMTTKRNTKHQTPSSREVPNLKHRTPKQMPGRTASRPDFELGAWSFFGAWSLEFGGCPSSSICGYGTAAMPSHVTGTRVVPRRDKSGTPPGSFGRKIVSARLLLNEPRHDERQLSSGRAGQRSHGEAHGGFVLWFGLTGSTTGIGAVD